MPVCEAHWGSVPPRASSTSRQGSWVGFEVASTKRRRGVCSAPPIVALLSLGDRWVRTVPRHSRAWKEHPCTQPFTKREATGDPPRKMGRTRGVQGNRACLCVRDHRGALALECLTSDDGRRRESSHHQNAHASAAVRLGEQGGKRVPHFRRRPRAFVGGGHRDCQAHHAYGCVSVPPEAVMFSCSGSLALASPDHA
jgi:hypothetical protein